MLYIRQKSALQEQYISYCPPFLYCIVRNDHVGELREVPLLRGKEVDEGERDKETPRTRTRLDKDCVNHSLRLCFLFNILIYVTL